MYNTQDNRPLQSISESVELLDNCSKQIIKAMDEQIDAIIASDAQKIEHLSEVHNDLSKQYKLYEQEFISDLKVHIGTTDSSDTVRLLSLKNVFPEYADDIENWHRKLTSNTRKLQRKHIQILELLEFAMSQNARMMHSMYTVHNKNNIHYAPTGEQSGVTTGVAINQEI